MVFGQPAEKLEFVSGHRCLSDAGFESGFPALATPGFVSGYRFSDTARSKSDAPLGVRPRGWWAAYTFLLRAKYFAIADQAEKPEKIRNQHVCLRSFYEKIIRNLWPVVSNTVSLKTRSRFSASGELWQD